MNFPLLSIIIPTKNRQKYAISIINNILTINNENFELIISDNSDSAKLKEYIDSKIKDDRVIYYYNSKPISMIENFNKSMSYANGKYICYIGDDDGVCSDIVKFTQWMDNQNIEALIGKNCISYSWPSDEKDGELCIYPFSGNYKVVNVRRELSSFLKSS